VPSRALPSLAITNALPRHVDVLVVGLTTSGARQVPKTVDAAFTKRFGISLLDNVARGEVECRFEADSACS